MASPTEPIRAFRGDRRSKVALRSILRGDSIWLRGVIFVMMSAIFFVLVSLTKRSGLQPQTAGQSDSTQVAPATPASAPPASHPSAPAAAAHAAPPRAPVAAPKPAK